MNQNLKRAKDLAGYFSEKLKTDGVVPTVKRTAGFVKRRFLQKKARFLPNPEVLQQQRETDCSAWPTISICIPLYNTPKEFFLDLIESVQQQTCPNWQLCLADCSDHEHNYIALWVKELASQDKRIVYTTIPNRGIAENTNQAAKLATGEYIALADHDDILAPHAVYWLSKRAFETKADFLYSDEALFQTDINNPITGHFKPDYSPEYLESCNYICHLAAFRKSLFWKVRGQRKQYDGAQDHDLFLRLIDTSKKKPVHIPKVLYYWRVHEGSTSTGIQAKPYVTENAQKAITQHLEKVCPGATVQNGIFPSTYKVCPPLPEDALVSILIPNKDHILDLDKALQSIYNKKAGCEFEVIVIENNSDDTDTFAYYKTMEKKYPNCRMVQYEGSFNFSAINNFGRKCAKGQYLLLLNNDVEVINDNWLSEMLAFCARDGVGIVGAMLYYPDETIQHAGVITGLGGYAGHSHKYARRDGSGYMFRTSVVQNLSAVTAACMMVRCEVYDQLGGLDTAFEVAFNDVDFCLRAGKAGWRIVWTPYAKLYHYESKSRGLDEQDPEKKARFAKEQALLKERHEEILKADPYYNPNLTLDREDFSESRDHRFLQEDRE